MSDAGAAGSDRPGALLALVRDSSISAWLSGLIAVIVGYGGPSVIILSAAAAGHLSAAETTSWIWAVSIACGVLCISLSLWTRMPIVIAWSTPGAALLITNLSHYRYRDVIGAYLISALAVTVIGATGWFGRLMARVPAELVAAMLAGILFNFGTNAFHALSGRPLVPAIVLGSFVLVRTLNPRYAIPLALVAGVLAAAASGQLHDRGPTFGLAHPHWTSPLLDASALIGVGLPLFIVTMTAQNAAGIGVLRSFGYQPDDRKLVTATGVGSLLAAPFGSHAVNLAAITAAICAGPTTHRDPARRYIAGVSAGVCSLIVGTFGATLIAAFADLPASLIASVAGVALLGAIVSSLTTMVADPTHREPAVITFLATVSGVTLAGIGSAFWGLVFGLVAVAVQRVLIRPDSRVQ
jgi:benzoate membrane transport protein